VKEALKAQFLPEFLNRIDETIVFHPLTRDEIQAHARDIRRKVARCPGPGEQNGC
jgi:ATP-dependent Clp protease ATP-binding subunit ClpA